MLVPLYLCGVPRLHNLYGLVQILKPERVIRLSVEVQLAWEPERLEEWRARSSARRTLASDVRSRERRTLFQLTRDPRLRTPVSG